MLSFVSILETDFFFFFSPHFDDNDEEQNRLIDGDDDDQEFEHSQPSVFLYVFVFSCHVGDVVCVRNNTLV